MTYFSGLSPDHPLVLVGCGNMGGAMLQSWLSTGLNPDHILILNKSGSYPNIKAFASVDEFPTNRSPRMLVFALKPQVMPQVLAKMKGKSIWQQPALSVAAGYSMASIQSYIGDQHSLIRSMPNTPSQVRKGIAGIFASPNSAREDCELAEALLKGCGEVVWVNSEDQIDMVTGVSGSGPAYFFLMVESLAQAGMNVGLPEDTAYKLARQTCIGAGALLEQSDDTATILRQKVTSPNGTTQAALEVLMQEDGLQQLMRRAVKSATNRARELSK